LDYQMGHRHVRWRWASLGGLVLSVVSGCSDPDATGSAGELGAGSFAYSCVADSDAACSVGGAVDALSSARHFGRRGVIPDAVAVGALFGLRFDDPRGDDTDTFRVVAASQDDEPVAGQYAISQPGTAAFLALQDSATVLDFALVEAREALGLVVWQAQEPVTSIRLNVGERIVLGATPVDEDGGLLGGALPLRWETMDSSLAVLTRLASPDLETVVTNEADVEVRAQRVGTTALRVSSGVLGAQVVVEVLP